MTDDPAVEQIPERFDEGPDDLRATLPERMRVTRQDYYRACRREMDPLGLPFDPQEHEAMTMVPNPDAEPNSVMDVMAKGYKLNGRLVRAAKVIVVKGD